MERRNFLKVSAAATVGIAGCIEGNGNNTGGSGNNTGSSGNESGSPGNQNGTDTNETTDTDNQSNDDTQPGSQRKIVSRNFQVNNVTCGEYANEAKVTRNKGGSSMKIEGTTWGTDGNKTAKLQYANYDPSTDTVLVGVDTKEKENAGVGMQCLVKISYELKLEIDGDLPENVVVVNNNVRSDAVKYNEITEATFKYSSSGDTDDRGGPEIERDEDEKQISIEGNIGGNNSCEKPVLKQVQYDESNDKLNVMVETMNPHPQQPCPQIMMNMEYEAELDFKNSLPSKVSVSHNGQEVAGSTYSSNSASASPPQNQSK